MEKSVNSPNSDIRKFRYFFIVMLAIVLGYTFHKVYKFNFVIKIIEIKVDYNIFYIDLHIRVRTR